MPLTPLLKNKTLLTKHYHFSDSDIDNWPYFELEERVKIINEISDEEEKKQKNEEEKQSKSMPNFNPSSYMNNMSSITNKFK